MTYPNIAEAANDGRSSEDLMAVNHVVQLMRAQIRQHFGSCAIQRWQSQREYRSLIPIR
jgi:hypothetical protein